MTLQFREDKRLKNSGRKMYQLGAKEERQRLIKEIEKALPKEKIKDEKGNTWFFDEGFNDCLAEVKEILKQFNR